MTNSHAQIYLEETEVSPAYRNRKVGEDNFAKSVSEEAGDADTSATARRLLRT